MRRLGLLSGLGAALLLMTAMVSVGVFSIWQQGIREQLDGLREERFRFSLAHVKSALESGLLLGMSTRDLPGAQALIAQVRNRQSDILSIDVFDPKGQVVFSTDTSAMGLQIPRALSGPCLQAGGQPWSTHADDADVQCVGLLDAFGQPAGGVLLRHRMPSRSLAGQALLSAWPIWSVAVLAALLGTLALGAAVIRPLEQRAKALRQQLAQTLDPLQGPPTEATPGFGPATEALQALARHRTQLRETDAEAERLDRMEAQ